MAEKDFVVKNGLVVNSAVTINSTAIYYDGSQFINSTSFTGTANNTSFVGTIAAANVVSNAHLAANLANYQTTAGLAANVATLIANNTSFVGTIAAANVVSNAHLAANLANYQTSAGLAANVVVLTANNSTRLNGQLASFYTDATNISTGTLASARISGNYTGITNVGTLGALTVSGNVALNNFSIVATTNNISITTSNVNIDSGVLFVDAINNRVGISNTTPDTQLTVTGSANVSQDIRIGRDLYVARDFIVAGNFTTTGTSVASGDFNPISNGYNLGSTTSLWNLFGIDATLTKNLFSNAVLVGTINATSNGAILTRTSFTIGNVSVNSTINSTSFTGTANNTSFVGTTAAAAIVNTAQLSGNLANYQTSAGLSANVATLTANNTSFVGTISAANVVSNAHLAANLANYQTSAGLAANVAKLIANNTSFVGSISAANVVSNAHLAANLANYQTSAGLAANVAILTANNTSFVGTIAAANVVSNAHLAANLANYQTTAGLSANVAVLTANNSTRLNGQLASFYTDATNLTTGTVPNARLSSVVVNTSANFTLSGNTTLAGTTTVISSNVNITGSFLNVASAFVANSTGAYHTGTVNAASHTIGTVVVVNTTILSVNGAVVNSTGGFFSGLVNATGFTAANLTVNSNAIIWTGNTTTSPTITLANSGSFTIGNGTTTQTSSIISLANSASSANITPAGFFGNGINITSLNATSITNGTLPSARISGAYTGITQVGTLAGVTVTGTSNFDSGVLFVDGTNNRVGVNTTTPSVSLQISSNDAVFLPVGNTLQRPTGSNGMFRFNSETSTFEGYANGSWGTIAGSGAGGYYKGNLGPTGNTNNKANLYRINSNTQSNNVTISAGENALTVGPIVIDTGYNLTIEEGGRAVII